MVSLPFFPTPLPDETLYSIVSRYHRLGGFADAQATCRKLFGNTDSGFMHDFPCGIDVLCESVNLWAGQQEATIRNHTMLPFYEPFLSEASLQATLAAMRQGDGERIKFILGLTASRLSAIHPLRACPECMNRDTIDFGSAYWHRSHQLPGVHVCGEHGVPLVILPLKTNKLSKYRYLLPCDIPRSHQLVAVQSDSAVTRLLLEISHNAKSLLDATLSPLDASRLCGIYRHGAAAAGFMLKSGKIDQQGLKSAFIERFRSLAIIPEFTEIIESAHGENSFLAALLRKPRSQKHPIKHLLLIQLLFGNVPKFLDAALSDTTPAAQPTARSRLRRSPTANFQESTMVQMRKLLLEDRLSLRAAAAHLGMTTSVVLRFSSNQAGDWHG